MKSTGFFLLGLTAGIVGAVAVDRLRKGRDPEDAELLSLRVAEHLRQLENRLEDVMRAKAPAKARKKAV